MQRVSWGTFQVAYEVWLALAAYIIVAPLIFFLPLGTAHTAMRNARDATLKLPRLIYPSLQVNIRAGYAPEPENNGARYLRIPFGASIEELL